MMLLQPVESLIGLVNTEGFPSVGFLTASAQVYAMRGVVGLQRERGERRDKGGKLGRKETGSKSF